MMARGLRSSESLTGGVDDGDGMADELSSAGAVRLAEHPPPAVVVDGSAQGPLARVAVMVSV